jgi:hypothetical protein
MKVFAYGLAGAVRVARVTGYAHFPSDVVYHNNLYHDLYMNKGPVPQDQDSGKGVRYVR